MSSAYYMNAIVSDNYGVWFHRICYEDSLGIDARDIAEMTLSLTTDPSASFSSLSPSVTLRVLSTIVNAIATRKDEHAEMQDISSPGRGYISVNVYVREG